MRFTIRWDAGAWPGGCYRVSLPEYDGGEVVTAEDYDRAVDALRDLLRLAEEYDMRIDGEWGVGPYTEDERLTAIRERVASFASLSQAPESPC